MSKHKHAAESRADQGTDETTAGEHPEPSALVVQVGIERPIEGQQASDAANQEPAGENQQDVENGEGQGELPGVDPAAPLGYLADGVTPRKSNRGRKAASVSDESDKQRNRLRSVTPSKARPAKVAAEITPLAVVNYQAMGESVASMWFHGGEMVFGPEWAPDTKEGEHLAVAGAFRDYFKATNMRDLPPGFALCFVLGVYSLKRANKPTVKTKLQGMGLWLKTNLRIRK